MLFRISEEWSRGHKMPYRDGSTQPLEGDRVSRNGKPGTVVAVEPNPGNMPEGHELVHVEWDDGSVGVGISLAVEYDFISRKSSGRGF
jgi:hypothetical protein